jgi:tripartite ATP-independent transporter DctM subunit
MELSAEAVAVIGFVTLFVLMLLRVPVGMAMGLVGVTGFGYLTGMGPALKLVGQTVMRTVTDYSFGVIPMFLLMGAFVSVSGISRELFRAANTFVGHWKGGLGIATIGACGGFAAISGSSVATAATFSAVAYPEMRRFGYPQSFATGVIAVGGTLGAMLPPSTVLVVYGIITQQDIGQLFMAGVIPGLLAIAMHMITIFIIGAVRPGFLPSAPKSPWKDRLHAVKDVWSPLALFLFVIGGLYGGFFIPTEAGAVGAVGAFIIGVMRGKLSKDGILQSLLQATRTAAAVFTILIGALCFGYFLTITQTPQHVTEFLTGLGIGKYGVLALILLMYLVLGCLMDAMAMIILTVPIVFPVVTALGFDPIWFGVIIVMTVELGLIHPPVGMNVFVIKSVIKDVNMSTIFAGVLPFVVTDLIRLVLLISFPILALWLPQRMMGG